MNITILQSEKTADITVTTSGPVSESVDAELTRWGLTPGQPSPLEDVYLLAHRLWQLADDVRIATERDIQIEHHARHITYCRRQVSSNVAHDDDRAHDELHDWEERFDHPVPTRRATDASPAEVKEAQERVYVAIVDENAVLPTGDRFLSHRIDIRVRNYANQSYYRTEEFSRDAEIAYGHVAQVFTNLEDTISGVTWGDAKDLYGAGARMERLGWVVSLRKSVAAH